LKARQPLQWYRASSFLEQFASSRLVPYIDASARTSRLSAALADQAPYRLQLGIASGCDVSCRHAHEDIGIEPGIRPQRWREVPNQRQVDFDSRVRQTEKVERPSVNAALIPTSRLADECAEPVLAHRERKLECGRGIVRAHENEDATSESRRRWLDRTTRRIGIISR
jgi:hypothetical protein